MTVTYVIDLSDEIKTFFCILVAFGCFISMVRS